MQDCAKSSGNGLKRNRSAHSLSSDDGEEVTEIVADKRFCRKDENGMVISEATKKQVMNVIKSHFRPEFINRLDEIIMFNPLGQAQMKDILLLQLGELNERLREQSIAVKADEKALEKMMKSAYDPLYGARPLKRFIEQTIVTDLSKRLIAGEVVPGKEYLLSVKEDRFTYTELGSFNVK